jgi:hypothetical protein
MFTLLTESGFCSGSVAVRLERSDGVAWATGVVVFGWFEAVRSERSEGRMGFWRMGGFTLQVWVGL